MSESILLSGIRWPSNELRRQVVPIVTDLCDRIATLEAERDEDVSQCITETERLMMLNDDLAGDKLVLQAERDALRRVVDAAQLVNLHRNDAGWPFGKALNQLRDALAALDKEQM